MEGTSLPKPSEEEPTVPDSTAFDIVHAQLLRLFPDLVRDLGGDPEEVLSLAGLNSEAVIGGRGQATYRQLVALLEGAAAALQCADFGMRLAGRQGGASIFGPLGQVMRNARTFGEAIGYVGGHAYAHSLAAGIWIRHLPKAGGLFAGHDILLDGLGNKAQAIELILLAGNLVAIELTGGLARARKVHFRHQPVSKLRTYRHYFGCEVLFGQSEDGVFFSEAGLACPVLDADAQAYRSASAYIRTAFTRQLPPLHARTRWVILHLLETRSCTNERVAAELKLHPRTLHRYLRAEGTSFHHIKDQVRRDLAFYYIRQTALDFCVISEKLGFAEQSVMTRRCTQWFSAAPTVIRSGANHGKEI